MKNRRAACFVPWAAAALVSCCLVVGAARGATQNDSDIESFPPTISQPPILLWHGFGPPASERALMEALPLDDVPALKVAMLTSKNAVELRDALAPYYRSSRDEQRLRLQLLDGLSHGWADSDHIDELRRAIANWFKTSRGMHTCPSSSTIRPSCIHAIAATRTPRKSAASRAC